MAWNEPGKPNNQNPWGGKGDDQGPPDLDEILRKVKKAFNRGGNKGGDGGNGGDGPKLSTIFISLSVLILVIWAALGFYQLDEAQEAVILRLGKFHSVKGPGLHWNPPLIDKRFIENTNEQKTYNASSIMLTEDQSVTVVPFVLQYNISDIKNFTLNVSQPTEILQFATESALRNVVGNTLIDDVITEKRAEIAEQASQILQDVLDEYQTGLFVSELNIGDATVPDQVVDALKDVNKALADQERMVNEATKYKNEIEPVARGEAEQILQQARGYKAEIIAKANGEAERFLKVLEEYEKAPQVTRERLYLEAIESVMQNSTKIIVDTEEGNNLLYLPLDKLMNESSRARTTSTPNKFDENMLINDIADKVVEKLNQSSPRTSRSRR